MAFPGGNTLSWDTGPTNLALYGGVAATVLLAALGAVKFAQNNKKQPQHVKRSGGETALGAGTAGDGESQEENVGIVRSFLLFFYSCFIKPHEANGKGNQQDALESFYKKQAGIYDRTRKTLLKGREDMLALVGAQLVYKATATAGGSDASTSEKKTGKKERRVWVDVSPPEPPWPSGTVNYCTGPSPFPCRQFRVRLTKYATGRRRHWLEH